MYCNRCEQTHDDDHETECIYCNTVVPCVPVPDADDDAAWAALEAEHGPGCEWVETRGNQG